MIQFVGRDAYKQFWNFSKDEKENLATQLAIELPALRGKVGASQEEIASAVGISRQTYSAYENRTRPIPWSLYLALLFYFDYIPSTVSVKATSENRLPAGSKRACRSVNPLHLWGNTSIRPAVFCFLHSICPDTDCGMGYKAYWPPAAAHGVQLLQCRKPCRGICRRMRCGLLPRSTGRDSQRNLPHLQRMCLLYTGTRQKPPSIYAGAVLSLLCAPGSLRGLYGRVLLPFASPFVKFCAEIALKYCRKWNVVPLEYPRCVQNGFPSVLWEQDAFFLHICF